MIKMSKENNYNTIAVAIVICVGIIASIVLVPMLLNYNQSNNNSYNPSHRVCPQ
jgi:membrane protein YdbS with pleckstrin-like domain